MCCRRRGRLPRSRAGLRLVRSRSPPLWWSRRGARRSCSCFLAPLVVATRRLAHVGLVRHVLIGGHRWSPVSVARCGLCLLIQYVSLLGSAKFTPSCHASAFRSEERRVGHGV